MNDYSMSTQGRRWPKVLLIIVVLLLVIGAGIAVVARRTYNQNLEPVSASEHSKIITIEIGTAPGEIAQLLEDEGVIRAAWAFEWYIKTAGLQDSLQAGTYSLKPSLGTKEVAAILTQGKVATDLVTILPGQRIDQIRDSLINDGFDQKAVDAALNPARYPNHPALVDKPKAANLEGYIYPESFEKTATTDPSDIIEAALDQMALQLTPDIRAGIVRQGLTVHEGVILASVIEREVSDYNGDDKNKVAQIFLSRLNQDIALESDATASYGAILDNAEPSLSYASPYNTYQNPGLPPGPISNVSQSSLAAVAKPAKTDYMYFVSGDDCLEPGGTCTNYFSRTLEEHEANVQRYCKQRCQ